MTEDRVETDELIRQIVRDDIPLAQLQIARILWSRYRRACTQQAVSYHLVRMGARKDDQGYWYLPDDQ